MLPNSVQEPFEQYVSSADDQVVLSDVRLVDSSITETSSRHLVEYTS